MRVLTVLSVTMVLMGCTTVDEPYYYTPYRTQPYAAPIQTHVHGHPVQAANNVHGHQVAVAPAPAANVHGHQAAVASNVHGHPAAAPQAARPVARAQVEAPANHHTHG